MLWFADDDTRVKLSVVGDDPHSDYINANHVPVSFYGELIRKILPGLHYYIAYNAAMFPQNVCSALFLGHNFLSQTLRLLSCSYCKSHMKILEKIRCCTLSTQRRYFMWYYMMDIDFAHACVWCIYCSYRI